MDDNEEMIESKSESRQRDMFLLHLCCAPCSPHPILKLKEEFDLHLYFYNPNIHPESEYQMRLEEVEKLARLEDLPLHVGDYRSEAWFNMTKGLENEPERGARCRLCILDRLEYTARKAGELGIHRFGSALTTSPHKDSVMINEAGKHAALELVLFGYDIAFYEADFKKDDGFKISSELSKKYGFIRQDYCGCTYSRTERGKSKASAKMKKKAKTPTIDQGTVKPTVNPA